MAWFVKQRMDLRQRDGDLRMAQEDSQLCQPVEVLVAGTLQNNIYLIGGADEQRVVVVDPGCKPEAILDAVGSRTVEAIVITHAHWDHVAGAAALREATGASVIAGEIDAPVVEGKEHLSVLHTSFDPCPVDSAVAQGDLIDLAGITWRVIHTPGHTRGGICLYLDPQDALNPEGAPLLVSGDTLFCGTIGRTDFDGGSISDMRIALRRLAELPDATVVLPGHNDLTTIAAERERVFASYLS